VLCSLHSDLRCLIRCVHDSSLWTQTIVPTKAIILIHALLVNTVGIGRLLMKLLVLVDFPSMLAALPIGLLILPLMSEVHAGSFIGTYVGALIELVTASCQWLAVGFAVDRRLEFRPWGTSVLRPVNKYFLAVVTFVLVLTVVAVPLTNKRSHERGSQQGAISFH
jgi:hypothetical protein